MNYQWNFTNQVCIVTGAGSGMGADFAKTLAAYGATVIVADVNSVNAERTSKEILQENGLAEAMCFDAASPESVDQLAKTVYEKYGRIDILVNSIGIGAKPKPNETHYDIWNRVIGVNLTGVYNCCMAIGEYMVQQKKGTIVNMASQAAQVVPAKTREGRGGEYGLFAYCSSKGGVRMLTKAIAVLWSQYGVRCNCISPGYVNTPLTAEPHSDPEIRKKLEDSVPLGYLADPADITGAMLYLASDISKYATGLDLIIDGGYTSR